MISNNKKHYCFNCGEETEDYDELPNRKKVWCCGSNECTKELRYESQSMEAEARSRAEDDNYRAYF